MDEVCKNIHDFGQNIDHLEILRTRPGNKTYQNGTNFLCQMKNLKYLKLKRINLSLENILSLTKHSPNLIAVEFCFDGRNYGVMEMSTAFERLFEIVRSTLKSFKCGFSGVSAIFPYIKYLDNCQNLEDVAITDNQRMSNQSKLGLISPISPTSPGLDWVTITFLTMD